MSRADELYVINRDMSVRSLRDGVRRRKPVVFPLPIVIDPDSTGRITDIQITDAGAPDPGSVEFSVADSGDGARGQDAVALSPDGTLSPGTTYPASNDAGFSFVLPVYALQETGGRYAASLKWLASATPGGPIARLTVGFQRRMPGFTADHPIKEIAHEVSARIVYSVPVENGTDTPAESWLSIPLGAVNRVDGETSQLVFDLNTKADFDQLWSAMTDPAAKGRLELRCFATVGRRTWRQIIPSDFGVQDQVRFLDRGVLLTMMIKPPKWRHVRPARDRPQPHWRREDLARRVLRQPFTTVSGGVSAAHLSTVHTLNTAVLMRGFDAPLPAMMEVAPLDLTPANSREMLTQVFRPDLTEALDISDLRVGARRVVPTSAFIDKMGRPALIRTQAEAVQAIAFNFDVDVNAYMFDVPGDLRPSMTRVLLRAEFDAGEGRPPVVYYQDTAFPGRYYYEPQEFRIPRREEAPYLPAVSIAFFDVVEAADANENKILYRAHLAYRAVPYLDRAVLARLKRFLGEGAVLSALIPEQAALRLRLPDDAGTAFTESERTAATISLDDGIIDEVQLTPEALAAVITALQSGGLDGLVTASLPGAANTSIPIRLSLHEASGVLLERSFRGPVGAGRVRVTVRNRIESPLTIAEFLATPAGDGLAFPDASPGLQIAAGAQADIDYRLDPPGTVLTDLNPVLRMTVNPDMPLLLPSIMVNRGYSSQTFTLSLSIDPMYFGQVMPGDTEALAAVMVEFEGDTRIVLDAATLTDDVPLRLPILDWLLHRPRSEHYRYRVTNLHGASADIGGQAGPWIDGLGAGAVAIVPAGA
jgi:hypothetical protein